MSGPGFFMMILAYAAALALAFWQGVMPETLLTWGAGGAALLWLVVLVTLPWDLHFRAREVLADLQRSVDSGISVSPAKLEFAAKIKRGTLIASLATHVLSAAVALALAVFSNQPLGYPFAGFYLLSCLVRPATAAVKQLRRRLENIAEDSRFPREDVLRLRDQVSAHEVATKRLGEELEAVRKDHAALEAATHEQRVALEQKLVALTRKFEDSLERLTDNRELIAGIKAFLRMIRDTP